MKKISDPRHQKRQNTVRQLFAHSFNKTTNLDELAQSVSDMISIQIDPIISENAPEWPIDQINRVDLSILRLAIYELIETKTPAKVIVDEAVELGKEFGSNASAKFINGVLGSYLKKIKKETE